MIDHDLHHRAYLTDLIAQQDYLTLQAEQLRLLLNETETRLAQNADLIDYMEGIIHKKPDIGLSKT